MVEENGYVNDNWLRGWLCAWLNRIVLFMAESYRGWFCSWQTVLEDRFVFGRKLVRTVLFMADSLRG
jgi:hypothetical protein